jgi:autotransporter-associated beta strand protein
MRETLNITGGSLTVNYDPAYRPDTSTTVLHGGPLSAQFSGAVTLSGTGSLNVNTLQVDATRTFTLAGSSGTLTFKQINLMPHSTTPAKVSVTGNVNINPLSNGTATISNGSGTGSTGFVDLSGGTRTFNVGNGSASVDLDVTVPITNGSLTKNGTGTMRISGSNTFSAVTIGGGVLQTNHATALTNTMAVTVNNGGTLDLNGITDAIASLSSAAGNTTGSVLQGTANLSLSATSGTHTYAGSITGTGSLTKNAASTQILAGNNSLGPVTISAGKLLFNGSNTTGNITVSTNGVLGGTGSVSGAVTLNNLGHLAPGASIESFDVGALTLNSGSVLDFELGAGGVMDRLNVTGLLTIAGSTVNLTDAGGMSTGLYTLIDYGTLSGSVTGLGAPNGPSSFKYSLHDTGSIINLRVSILGDFNFDDRVDASDYVVWRKGLGTTYTQADYDLWRAHYGETAGSGSSFGGGGTVPEPSIFAFFIFAALPFVARRRRAQ